MKIVIRIVAIFAVIFFCQSKSIMAEETSRLSTGVTVPVIQSMNLSPSSFVFPDVSSIHLDKGFIEARDAATITVSSNVAWQLTVQSEDPDMGKVEDNVKPLSDFLWKKSGDINYTAISTEGHRVDSSAGYVDHQKAGLDYKMLVGWTRDKPGTYGLTLRFTLSTLE
ncbi:MAG: hypothetical protein L6247_09400 [Desulfobacteraceae bacterium]|nr:hypothetical protein [Desulfobacteraceae bacterium]